jgi:hypothetical protein
MGAILANEALEHKQRKTGAASGMVRAGNLTATDISIR